MNCIRLTFTVAEKDAPRVTRAVREAVHGRLWSEEIKDVQPTTSREPKAERTYIEGFPFPVQRDNESPYGYSWGD